MGLAAKFHFPRLFPPSGGLEAYFPYPLVLHPRPPIPPSDGSCRFLTDYSVAERGGSQFLAEYTISVRGDCQFPAPNSDHIVIREELLTATLGNLVIRVEMTVAMFCNFVRGNDNRHGL